MYRIYIKYSNTQARANSIDPSKTRQSASSDLDKHCLPLIQQFLNISTCFKNDLFKQVNAKVFDYLEFIWSSKYFFLLKLS